MKYIVFDLEMNNKWGTSIHEIIEIGAVKINQDLVIEDDFQAFVRPKTHTVLSRLIKKKTRIRQEWVDRAPLLPVVLERFRDWIGPDDFLLCGWSSDDHLALQRNYKMNGLAEPKYDLLNNYRDIQKSFINLFQQKNQVSLKNALEMLNLTPKYDIWHRAIYDAFHTAQVFVEIYDKIDFDRG